MNKTSVFATTIEEPVNRAFPEPTAWANQWSLVKEEVTRGIREMRPATDSVPIRLSDLAMESVLANT